MITTTNELSGETYIELIKERFAILRVFSSLQSLWKAPMFLHLVDL